MRNGKTIELALSIYNRLQNIPEGLLIGLKRKNKTLFITKQQVIPIDLIKNKIYILEKLQKEFPNNEELRIKIITLKELIKEFSGKEKKWKKKK